MITLRYGINRNFYDFINARTGKNKKCLLSILEMRACQYNPENFFYLNILTDKRNKQNWREINTSISRKIKVFLYSILFRSFAF